MVMDPDLARILDPGRPQVSPAFDGPQEGRISRVADGRVFFRIPEWSETRTFGPARWAQHTTADVAGGAGDASFASHHHPVAPPAVGQWCVVVFIAGDLDRPWVLAWSS